MIKPREYVCSIDYSICLKQAAGQESPAVSFCDRQIGTHYNSAFRQKDSGESSTNSPDFSFSVFTDQIASSPKPRSLSQPLRLKYSP